MTPTQMFGSIYPTDGNFANMWQNIPKLAGFYFPNVLSVYAYLCLHCWNIRGGEVKKKTAETFTLDVKKSVPNH